MPIISRLADVIAANINALLDRVEDPEVLLEKHLRDLEDGLGTVHQQAARIIAAERRLRRDLEAQREAAARWQDRARLAVREQRDDLARRALAHKLEHDALIESLQRQHGEAAARSDEIKSLLRTLQGRLADFRRRQQLACARRRAASVSLEIQRIAAKTSVDVASPFSRFANLEMRIVAIEDDLMAQIELGGIDDKDVEFDKLEIARSVETALSELKGDIG